MQLRYYLNDGGNFGDDLNDWLWGQLIPEMLDQDDSCVLVGMGTLLGEWFTQTLPPHSHRVVLGAGAGKDRVLPRLTRDWTVYGVRGPLTAALLDLPARAVLTDPAMAVRTLWRESRGEPHGIGFMPHYFSTASWDWRDICHDLGLTYIDPQSEPLPTVGQIAGLKLLLTEAMHGAIVADALRVPWMALKIAPNHNSAKWDDWGGSLGEVTFFHAVPALHDARRVAGRRARLKSWAKRQLRNAGGPRLWTIEPSSTRWEVDRCRDRLRYVLDHDAPQLSRDSKLDQALDRFSEAVEAMRRDWRAGRLGPGRARAFNAEVLQA